VFARQLCCRVPGCPGFRPVVLRPALSGGLPLSGCESFGSYTGSLQGGCQRTGIQALENNRRFRSSRSTPDEALTGGVIISTVSDETVGAVAHGARRLSRSPSC